MSAKLTWKLLQVHGHELEQKLNELSESDYEIFSVQYAEGLWAIVARKSTNEISRTAMGFRAP